jgi:predicted HicB family RNase H-like nuclease
MPRKKAVPRAKPRRRRSETKGEAVEGWLSEEEAATSSGRRGRPKKAVARKPVTVYLPPELHKSGKIKALDEEKTFSDLVADALAEYLRP